MTSSKVDTVITRRMNLTGCWLILLGLTNGEVLDRGPADEKNLAIYRYGGGRFSQHSPLYQKPGSSGSTETNERISRSFSPPY